MFQRATWPSAAIVLPLLLVPLLLPDVARADEEADLRAAFAQGMALYRKGDYAAAAQAYERALELAPRVFGPEHVDTAAVLNNLALVYFRMCHYAQAEPLFQRSLKIREAKLGPNHYLVKQSLNSLADVYRVMGQYAQAVPLYQRSLKMAEVSAPPEELATILKNLAGVYAGMRQYAQAEPLYRRSLEIREWKLGPDHADVVTSLNDLALMYKAWGQYTKAEPLYQRILKIYEAKRGPDHLDTANCLYDLATLDTNLGRYAQAEPLYQRSLKIYEAKLGPDHPNVATALNDLAVAYYNLRRYPQAEPLLLRSLKIRESKLGPDHLLVAMSLGNLAELYEVMGQYARAEASSQRCLKIRESQLGPDHPDVAKSLNNLAMLCKDMGRYARAEPLFQRSLKIRESKLGPDDPDVAASLNDLANLYVDMGLFTQAEPLYQRSLKIFQLKFGPADRHVASTLNNLANLYTDTGQFARAVPLYQRSLKIDECAPGPEDPHVATTLNNLVSLYVQMGLFAQAEPLSRRSIEICRSKLGPADPLLATCLNNRAMLYSAMGRYDQAVTPLLQSLKIRVDTLGPDHLEVAGSLNNLATLYMNTGQYAEAEPLLQRGLKILQTRLGPDHPDVATSRNNLAEVYCAMGQYARAEPLHQRNLKILESRLGPDHPHVFASLSNLALLYAATGRWPEAVAAIDRERRSVRRHVARTLPVLSEKEQLTFLQAEDERQWHFALSLGLHQRAAADGPRLSAGWVLNGKAVVQEVLAQRSILAAAGTDPALAGLVKQLLAVRNRLAAVSMAAPKPGQEAAYRAQIDTLGKQEQELSRQLGQVTGRDSTGDPWVEPAAVRRVLAKEAVLIEVARHRAYKFPAKAKEDPWSAPRYTAWLMPAEGQGQIAIVDLGEAQPIDNAVQTARKVLEKAVTTISEVGEAEAERQVRAAMRDLTELVFLPLERHFGNARQLILSPDAALWLVPWAALPLADGKYAIEKYQIRYVISGRDLVSRGTTRGWKPTGPVLFANPDFDLGPGDAADRTRAVLRSAAPTERVVSSRGVSSLSSLGRVERLPGTAKEAAAIRPSVARYARSEPVIYEDQYALEGVFKSLHGPQVLVLSTHGFFLPDQEVEHKDDRGAGLAGEGSKGRAVLTTEGKPMENPLLRCGLLLAGCNQRTEEASAEVDDGILAGLEIVGTDLRGTDLVVLSACETGLGQVRNGEGVAGLRQAFQLAGAKAVVATLWQIPDEETVALMKAFFRNLSAGQGKAEALRNAQLSLIKARRAAHSAAHPYYWAAFTLTGQ
jgi:tetratricopeptide (TPR) repeat protein/CHAT domain-containing protein